MLKQYNADYKETEQEDINASYTLKGTGRDNVEKIKYLGKIFTDDFGSNTLVSSNCTMTNRVIGFLKHNLDECPQDVKKWEYD